MDVKEGKAEEWRREAGVQSGLIYALARLDMQ